MNRRLNHSTTKSPRLEPDRDERREACTLADAPMFESTHPADHIEARKLCERCPLVQGCLRQALDVAAECRQRNRIYRGPDGTWGGLLWKGGEVVDIKRPARQVRRSAA